MKRIIFTVFCSGIYESYLDVDDDFCTDNLDEMSNEEFETVRRYVCRNLDEAPIGEIEWIADVDVDSDDIREIRVID